jgi:NADH-quinone oxidoreductase subunit G
VAEMADHVVWLPTNTTGSDLRDALAGAPGAPGALVSVSREDTA